MSASASSRAPASAGNRVLPPATDATVRFSPCGQFSLTHAQKNQFKVWSTRDQKCLFAHTDAAEIYNPQLAGWYWIGSRHILVLGCKTSGHLQFWEFTDEKANLLGTFTELANAEATCLAAHAGRNSVFVATKGRVVEADVDSLQVKQTIKTKKDVVLQMAANAERLVTVCATKIRVYAVSDGTCTSKFTAPVHACTSVAVSGSKIAACDSTESVSLYDYNDEAFATTLSTGLQLPLRRIVAVEHQHQEHAVGTSSGETKNTTRQANCFVALTADGQRGFVWNDVSKAAANAPAMPDAEICAGNAAKPILGLQLLSQQHAVAKITLARGSLVLPEFLVAETSNTKKKIDLEVGSSSTVLGATGEHHSKDLTNSNKRTRDHLKQGEEQQPDLSKPAKVQILEVAAKQAKTRPTAAGAGGGVGGSLIDEATVKYMKDKEEAVEREKVEILNEKAASSSATGAGAAGMITVVSSVKQYLKSKDAKALATVLSQIDSKVIKRSTGELTSKEAFEWFFECQKLLSTQPHRANTVLDWMRCVLTTHCSYLLSNPELKDRLEPLYKSLEERLQAAEPLQRIQGKLDLLLCTARERAAARAKTDEAAQTACIVYDEAQDNMNGEENNDEEGTNDDSELSGLDADDLEGLLDDDAFDEALLA
ncbi:unnamed protein product [Amoebophrya sp. A120]|nr:unnamed protein product [Amoebophrya sp. A120]|eukprot:GSA120T00023538001.1